MTTSDKENLERKLDHVLQMGDRIINLYPHITCTERSALLLAMTAAVRQVAANMRTVAALLRRNLLDTFRVDYLDYARQVENLKKLWDEELMGAPMFHNLDNQCRPITAPNEIALKEDLEYDLTIRSDDEEGFDFWETRVGLMRNASVMCEAIYMGLENIGKTLREITDDYTQLKTDIQRQDKRLQELEKQYEEMMWEEDRKRLIKDVKMFIRLRNHSREKETFQLFLERMEWEATDPHGIKILAELNEWTLAGGRPAGFIVENRDKLSIEDIARHFNFVRCRRILSQHVESFDLLQPADEEYKDLFVNKAAQELALILSNTIGLYVDFKHNYQYAALQMAMQDLGLVYSDRGNGIQMKDYINKTYLKDDEQIKDQTTLTQWTGKLLGSLYGTMDEQHLKGNYTRKDFEKMKDCYWLCLSIINKIVQLDLKELQFAEYLYEDHEKTPNINDYKNKDGKIIMDRLSILKSVIKGESIFS